jgi:putative hydrolases of HD superfamily
VDRWREGPGVHCGAQLPRVRAGHHPRRDGRADPARAAQFAVFHDTQETRIGDIPYVGRRYLQVATNEAVTADQVAACPPAVARVLQDIVDTYEAQDTLEARVARDADKLECLIQVLEYRHQGYSGVQDWIDNCRATLKTTSAQQIADAAERLSGLEWRSTTRSRTDVADQ